MTLNYLDSFATILASNDWGALTDPKTVYVGPIPPVLEFPVIGLIATEGNVDDETLASFEMDEVLAVTVLLAVVLNDPGASYRALLGYRDEIRSLVYSNPELGYPVQGGSGVEFCTYLGWESEFLAQENNQSLLQSLTVRAGVKYKQSI